MTTPRITAVTIGQLEASFPLYCRALRILVREGMTLTKIKRTVCWNRLAVLHTSLPRNHKDPEPLYLLLKRELTA
jgi:hypothetical protein